MEIKTWSKTQQSKGLQSEQTAQKRKRASFDFETYGWDIEEITGIREVRAICCGIITAEGRKERFLVDETQKEDKALVERVMLEMMGMAQSGEAVDFWGHNSMGFDALFLLTAAERLGWWATLTIGGMGVVCADFSDGKTKFSVKDTRRMIPSKLKKIAEDFDLPSRKLFVDSDYQGDMRDLPLVALKAGCLADCKIVLEALDVVEKMFEERGGLLKTTFSSSTLTVVQASLRKRGVKLPQHIARNKEYVWANKYSRAAYFGGRVEVFHHIPPWLIAEDDINSSYPWSMTQELPLFYQTYVLGHLAHQVLMEHPSVHGIVNAKVSVPKADIPVLPYRPDSGGVYFPYGDWEGVFTAVELRYAMRFGVKVEATGFAVFESGFPFSDFVKDLFSIKQTSTGALREFVKYLLNGCYGKFGEHPERERIVVAPSEREALEYMLSHDGCRQIDDERAPCLIAKEYERWAPHSHFALASYVTAYSRMKLHQEMLACKGLAYVDTDSVHSEEWMGEHSADLGQMKRVEEKGERVEGCKSLYYAPKIYKIVTPQGKVIKASKGFPIDLDFDEIVAGRDVSVSKMRMAKSQLKKSSTEVLREKNLKHWNGHSSKRKPHEDGSTEAWSVSELDARLHFKAMSPLFKKP